MNERVSKTLSQQTGPKDTDFGEAFGERNPGARELPETKLAIARQAAEVLGGEYADSLPGEELRPLTYILAVKAMETMMRESSMGFESWKADNPVEAKKLEVIMQVALSMQGKIAIPKTLDPAKYIKEIKRDKRWSGIFGKNKKEEELELELNKKLLDAIERAEALNNNSDKVEAEQKRIIEEAESKADTIIRSAEEKGKIIEAQVSQLKTDISALESIKREHLENPGVAKDFFLVQEAQKEKEVKIIELAFSDFINFYSERNIYNVKDILIEFNEKILNPMKIFESQYGANEVKLLAKNLEHKVYFREDLSPSNYRITLDGKASAFKGGSKFVFSGNQFFSKCFFYLSGNRYTLDDIINLCGKVAQELDERLILLKTLEDKIKDLNLSLDSSSFLNGFKLKVDIQNALREYEQEILCIKRDYKKQIYSFENPNQIA